MNEQTLSKAASERLETLRKEAFYARICQAHLRTTLALWFARTAIAIDHDVLQNGHTGVFIKSLASKGRVVGPSSITFGERSFTTSK